ALAPARDHAQAAPARRAPGHRGGRRGVARAARTADRPRAPVHPPHVGVADAQRERLTRRAPRLRVVVQQRGSRGLCVDAHAGGSGRHARARQGRADGLVAEPADQRRATGAGHVAGDLPVRAPRPRRRAIAAGHADGRV
ncbi:MAG: UPF0047 protein YjbQ, partial [uncultured Solirubrobacteraceae bacterium]